MKTEASVPQRFVNFFFQSRRLTGADNQIERDVRRFGPFGIAFALLIDQTNYGFISHSLL